MSKFQVLVIRALTLILRVQFLGSMNDAAQKELQNWLKEVEAYTEQEEEQSS